MCHKNSLFNFGFSKIFRNSLLIILFVTQANFLNRNCWIFHRLFPSKFSNKLFASLICNNLWSNIFEELIRSICLLFSTILRSIYPFQWHSWLFNTFHHSIYYKKNVWKYILQCVFQNFFFFLIEVKISSTSLFEETAMSGINLPSELQIML